MIKLFIRNKFVEIVNWVYTNREMFKHIAYIVLALMVGHTALSMSIIILGAEWASYFNGFMPISSQTAIGEIIFAHLMVSVIGTVLLIAVAYLFMWIKTKIASPIVEWMFTNIKIAKNDVKVQFAWKQNSFDENNKIERCTKYAHGVIIKNDCIYELHIRRFSDNSEYTCKLTDHVYILAIMANALDRNNFKDYYLTRV